MNATRTTKTVVLAAALGLTACTPRGGVDQECYNDAERCIDSSGQHNKYVVDELIMPDGAVEATMMGLDVDGDGAIDNSLGNIIQAISQIGPQIDVARVFNDFLDDGTWILLIDVQATSMNNASGAAGRIMPGINPGVSPCASEDDCGKHLVPGTSFDVDSEVPFTADLSGEIESGTLYAGPNKASLYLDFQDIIPLEPITLKAVGVRTETTATPSGASGVLAGGVHAQEFKDAIFPVFGAIVQRDCTGTGSDCCEPDSAGEAVLASLNVDGDCTLTDDELHGSSALNFAFRPDVDLLDASGRFNPGADGVAESISLGALFTSIPANFDM